MAHLWKKKSSLYPVPERRFIQKKKCHINFTSHGTYMNNQKERDRFLTALSFVRRQHLYCNRYE